MADIARRFNRRGDLESTLLNMFVADRFNLFANDYTEEGRYPDLTDARLCLFYVRTENDEDIHVATWHKNKRSGWIFQSAYELLRTAA